MTTYHINEDELYPVFELVEMGPHTIDLTDEELADYNQACEHWQNWQARLDAAYYPNKPAWVEQP